MFTEDELFMEEALLEAQKAFQEGELPVGAVVTLNNRIIGRGHNIRETSHDATAHAEILAIRQASEIMGSWRLSGCCLYVTLEPCPMCAGAVVQSRISRVIYGARDEQAGCAGSVYRITEDPAFNHYAPSTGGVLENQCKELMDRFFAERR